MIIRVDLPKLLFTTKNGREIYLDPVTGKPKSREIAFAGFELLKNDASKRVYLDELRKKTENSENTKVSIIKDSQGVNITGETKLKAPPKLDKKNPKQSFFNSKKFFEDIQIEEKPLKRHNNTAMAYYLMNYVFVFMNSKMPFEQENETDFDFDSKPKPKHRRKRLKLLA